MSNKEILIELLKKNFESRLKIIEQNTEEEMKTLQTIDKDSKDITKTLHQYSQILEEKEKKDKIEKEKQERLAKEKQERLLKEKLEKQEKERKLKEEKKNKEKARQAGKSKPRESAAPIPTSAKGDLTGKNNRRNSNAPRPVNLFKAKQDNAPKNEDKKVKTNRFKRNASKLNVGVSRNTIGGTDEAKPKKLVRSRTLGNIKTTDITRKETSKKDSNNNNKDDNGESNLKHAQTNSFGDKIDNKPSNNRANIIQEIIQNLKIEDIPTLTSILDDKRQFKCITSFLSKKDIFNILSLNKSFVSKLIDYIYSLKTKFFKDNNLPTNHEIDLEIQKIKNENLEEEINKEIPPLVFKKNTEKGLEMINAKMYTKIFRLKQITNVPNFSKIEIVYRIYCLLAQKENLLNIEKSQQFWKEFTEWIANSGCEKISDFFLGNVKDKEYTNEQIYKLRLLVNNNPEKIYPKEYSSICPTTGFICFVIKDIFEYLGIIMDKKSSLKRIIENYEFMKTKNTTIDKKIKHYITELNSM